MRGSIVKNKRKGGITYSAVVDYPAGKGKRRQVKKTFASKKEAEDELIRMLAEAQALDEGGYVDPGKMTVGKYLDHYLDAVRPGLKPKTVEGKRYMLLYWQPLLGNILLSKLTKLDVQRAVNSLPAHLAPGTKQEAFRTLRTALRQAMKWDMLPRDPTGGIKPPAGKRREMRAFDRDQAAKFMAAAKGYVYHALFVLALKSGMRLGELSGLKWEDVDLAAAEGTVTVRRTLYYPKDRKRQGDRPVLQEPKTPSSRRKIPLDQSTIQLLRTNRKEQLQQRLAAGPAWEEWGLVFTTPTGQPVHPRVVLAAMQRTCRRAGVPRIRIHDLRHTHASLLLQAGVPVKVVAERLGHSSVKITLDTYAHVLPGMQEAAVKALADL